MKKLYLLFLMGGFLGSFQGVAQQLKINQSQQIKDLMEVKKEFSRQEKTYQIQVYNGNVTEANEHVKRATSKFPYPSFLVFETPGAISHPLGSGKSANQSKEYLSSCICRGTLLD